uniref:Pecanex-like protein n=1 Tax=Mesocestoides corti TaxID=53468 RepID=A0A5K3FXY0_MESCO
WRTLVQHKRLYLPTTSQNHTSGTVHPSPPGWPRHFLYAAPHVIRVLFWLAAYLPRMPLERRETQDSWSNMSAPSYVVRATISDAHHSSPPRWPPRSLYTASQACPSLVGCLTSSHAIGTQRDTGLAEAKWSNMSALWSVVTLRYFRNFINLSY